MNGRRDIHINVTRPWPTESECRPTACVPSWT